MKRIAIWSAVVALFVMVLALAGCSSGAGSSAASASSDAVSSAAAPASTEAASAGSEGSSESAASAASQAQTLENGEYTATFNTDSSMFHVNEANDGRGTLTVSDDGMTIHVSLVSKKIVNVYAGTAEEAQSDGAQVIEPTTDKVTYSDGSEKEVYGFDIPVPALDEEFDVAILGEKGKWYDHRVSVTDPVSL